MYERFGLYADGEAPHRVLPLASVPAGLAYRRYAKRLLDLVIVGLAAPVALVIIALAALGLVLREGGSPFYRQERIGLHGRVFGMWKLRTMVPDAEAVLGAYLAANPAARIEWDHHQKLKSDPRITRFGALLRKTSLDELPQLWNVVTGDMSIVGPRPMMRDQRVLYPGTEYYVMRPGITGLWQTSARNESSFHERAGFDQAYYRALSLRTDLAIIWRTFSVVLRGTGC